MGIPRTMKRVKEWKFPPSNKFKPDGSLAEPWTVTLWENGKLSCNCPIWCQLRQPDPTTGERSCKHLRGVQALLVMEGNPPITFNFTKVAESPKPNLTHQKPLSQTPKEPTIKVGKRRIILED